MTHNHNNVENLILDTSADIHQLSIPLQRLGILGFFYMKVYHDGSFIDLTTDTTWASQFFTKFFEEKYRTHEINDHMFVFEDISLWELNSHNTIWQEAKDLFGFGNGITITKKTKLYNEKYCFYSSAENKQINNFYLNHIHILKQFIAYFNEKTARLMQKVEPYKLLIPQTYIDEKSNTYPCHSYNIKDFLTELEGVYLEGIESFARLSKREFGILKWLASGKSAKEIGTILNISNRTVEQHIKNLKLKLKCFKTSQLTNIASKYQLDVLFKEI